MLRVVSSVVKALFDVVSIQREEEDNEISLLSFNTVGFG